MIAHVHFFGLRGRNLFYPDVEDLQQRLSLLESGEIVKCRHNFQIRDTFTNTARGDVLYGVPELSGRVLTVDPKRQVEVYRISRELKKGGSTLHLIDENRDVDIRFTSPEGDIIVAG